MKQHSLLFSALCLMLFVFNVSATVRYVDLNCANPTPPYADWSTAATNIQNAVDAASAGDQVLVTNGIYQTGGRVVYGSETNRVVLSNAITLLSANGPAVTLIVGGTQMRCVYVGSNSMLSGFTLTNGQARTSGDLTNEESGAGAWCATSGIISNCLVTKNYNVRNGGGIYGGVVWNSTIVSNTADNGGGVASATLFNCMIASNSGGGAYSSILSNCILIRNGRTLSGGGAAYCGLNNSVISQNTAVYNGGGTFYSTLTNCTLSGNSAGTGGGSEGGTLNNCLITSNTATSYGGGAFISTLNNCSIIKNSATNYSGGGAEGGALNNCIIFYNTAPTGSNFDGGTLNYCCTTPFPTNGFGNITNEPAFVNLAGGDFHLQSNSPCINAGSNIYFSITNDFDGNARIVGGTMDVGAYEFQSPSSILSYAWAQRYGLPIDGSADNADSDGDGMNNWKEWQSGTIPTNAASVLKLSSPTNSVSGVKVTWQSVSGMTYYLQSSTNLPAFVSIQSNLVGQAGTTSYTDTTATNGGSYFYRVGVQ